MRAGRREPIMPARLVRWAAGSILSSMLRRQLSMSQAGQHGLGAGDALCAGRPGQREGTRCRAGVCSHLRDERRMMFVIGQVTQWPELAT